MADMPPPPASPLAAAQARAGVTTIKDEQRVILVTLHGVQHRFDVAAPRSYDDKAQVKGALRALGYPTDDEELLILGMFWLSLKRTQPRLGLRDVLQGIDLATGITVADEPGEGDPEDPQP